MISQLVPFDTSIAQAPAVAGRIGVDAEPPSLGMTLDEAELTSCAAMFLSQSIRPGKDAAAGKVSVKVPDGLMIVVEAEAATEPDVPVSAAGVAVGMRY